MKTINALYAALLALAFTACTGQKGPHIHQWGDYEPAIIATCTAEGAETRICSLDRSHTETRIVGIYPAAHDWGGWTEITAPACEEPGEGTRTCARGVIFVGNEAFFGWTSSQTIYVEGRTSEAAADAAWGSGWDKWRSNCDAAIKYWNGREWV